MFFSGNKTYQSNTGEGNEVPATCLVGGISVGSVIVTATMMGVFGPVSTAAVGGYIGSSVFLTLFSASLIYDCKKSNDEGVADEERGLALELQTGAFR